MIKRAIVAGIVGVAALLVLIFVPFFIQHHASGHISWIAALGMSVLIILVSLFALAMLGGLITMFIELYEYVINWIKTGRW